VRLFDLDGLSWRGPTILLTRRNFGSLFESSVREFLARDQVDLRNFLDECFLLEVQRGKLPEAILLVVEMYLLMTYDFANKKGHFLLYFYKVMKLQTSVYFLTALKSQVFYFKYIT